MSPINNKIYQIFNPKFTSKSHEDKGNEGMVSVYEDIDSTFVNTMINYFEIQISDILSHDSPGIRVQYCSEYFTDEPQKGMKIWIDTRASTDQEDNWG